MKTQSPNLATSCQVVSYSNTDSCQLYTDNFFFSWKWLLLRDCWFPCFLPYCTSGGPMQPVLAPGDRSDTRRHRGGQMGWF